MKRVPNYSFTMVQGSHLVVGSSVAVWHFSDRIFDGIFRFHSIGGVAPPEPEDPSRRRPERFDTHLRQRADDLYEGGIAQWNKPKDMESSPELMVVMERLEAGLLSACVGSPSESKRRNGQQCFFKKQSVSVKRRL